VSLRLLTEYAWPGNVRELQNLVERLIAVTDNNALLSSENLPLENIPRYSITKNMKESMNEFERRYIKNALAEAGGSQTRAAERIGIHRTTLISKIKQLKLK
jgi:transcriptional regulator with PAS, ATPase and Fis domain